MTEDPIIHSKKQRRLYSTVFCKNIATKSVEYLGKKYCCWNSNAVIIKCKLRSIGDNGIDQVRIVTQLDR